jgi:hypothetical protein
MNNCPKAICKLKESQELPHRPSWVRGKLDNKVENCTMRYVKGKTFGEGILKIRSLG